MLELSKTIKWILDDIFSLLKEIMFIINIIFGDFFKSIWQTLIIPKKFFENLLIKDDYNEEHYFKEALHYYFMLAFIMYFSGIIMIALSKSAYLTDDLVYFTIIYVLSTIIFFASIYLVHFFVKLFKAREKITKTYQACIYAATPSFLFAYLPYLNYVGMVWSIVLSVFALSIVHKIKLWKSLLAYLISAFIVFGIVFLGLTGYILMTGAEI